MLISDFNYLLLLLLLLFGNDENHGKNNNSDFIFSPSFDSFFSSCYALYMHLHTWAIMDLENWLNYKLQCGLRTWAMMSITVLDLTRIPRAICSAVKWRRICACPFPVLCTTATRDRACCPSCPVRESTIDYRKIRRRCHMQVIA